MSKVSRKCQAKRELISQINEAKQLKKDKWKTIKKLQLEMLKLYPNNLSALYDLMNIARKNNNLQELKKWTTKILELKPERVACYFNLIKVAQVQEDWGEVKRLASRILELEPNNKKAPYILRNAIRNERTLSIKNIKKEYDDDEKPNAIIGISEISFEERKNAGSQRIIELREQLYNGMLSLGKVQEISEELKDNFEGRLFIAEMCSYFNQPKLALQALKGYQQEHQEDMTKKEQKVLVKALEFVRSKKILKDSIKWSTVYSKEDR